MVDRHRSEEKAHRNDIDGLRGIAVSSVVLFHCGFIRFFPGGFTGVDIFFVISGYLITGLICQDLTHDRFSIVDFYRRRVRRIFPALVPMYVFVLLGSFFVFMPGDTAQTSRNLISSILFVSNNYFYSQAGYFDPFSESNLVLHTWSLSVEEQFYVVFPALLFVSNTWFGRFRNPFILFITLGSFAGSIYAVRANPSAAFYLIHYRCWELLIGGLLSLNLIPTIRSRFSSNVVAACGLVMIGASVLVLNAQAPFPGASALPACLGTAALLHAGASNDTLVSRLLKFGPLRFVGLVSYSFYLWHWPIWVLARQFHEPTGPIDRAIVILISFCVAALSWKFVEQPFRRASQDVSGRKVLVRGFAAMAAVAVVAFAAPSVARNYWAVPDSVEAIANFGRYYDPVRSFRADKCFLTSSSNSFALFQIHPCLDISTEKPNVALIGDSHAAQYYAGLASNPSINVLQATSSGCKPVGGSLGQARCTNLMDFMFDHFLPEHRVDVVILAARWHDSDIPGLLSVVGKLRDFVPRVVVIGPIIEYDISLPAVLAQSVYRDDDTLIAHHRSADVPVLDSEMRQDLRGSGAEYVSVYDAMCPGGACMVRDDEGQPIQFDYGHVTANGSKIVISKMLPQILPTLASSKAADAR